MGNDINTKHRTCLRVHLGRRRSVLPIGEARAQTTFGTIQAFGDSYADTGNLFKILGMPNPLQYPTGRFSGGTNFVDTTSSLLGIPQNNFAIGGAKTGTDQRCRPGHSWLCAGMAGVCRCRKENCSVRSG